MTEPKWKRLFSQAVILLLAGLMGASTLLLLIMHRQGGENYAVMGMLSVYLKQQAAFIVLPDAALSLAVSLISFGVMYSVFRGKTKWLSLLLKYRWYISMVLLVLCVLLEISNTSMQKWQTYLPGSGAAADPFWGVARDIRIDEWGTWSVFTFSQNAAGYPAVNPLMDGGRGVDPSWISVGGIPAWNLAAFFKPFYWGFLTLGLAKGFSFLFAARMILLVNVSYELALVYTKEHKGWSLTVAVMLALSPCVQWWFSQSIAEVLIFGQGILLCLHRYLKSKNQSARVAWSILLAWSVGCYIMIGYISWLISCGYLIIACGVLLSWQHRKELSKKDMVTLAIPAGAVFCLLGVIVRQSWDTLMAVQNSVYPGERLITGGIIPPAMYSDAYSLFLPFVRPANVNWSEASSFVTWAPAGLFLQLWNAFRRKHVETLDILLLVTEGILLFFMAVGIPPWLAKATLFSQVNRPELVWGITDTVLLIRALVQKEAGSWKIFIPLAVILSAAKVWIARSVYEMDHLEMLLLAGIYGLGFLTLFRMDRKKPAESRLVICVLAAVAVLGGGFVNPLQQDISRVEDMEIIQAVQSLDPGQEDVWIVEGDWPITEIPLLAGKKTISTQAYPVPALWKKLDPEGQYERYYNRFSHLSMSIDLDSEPVFSNPSEDQLMVVLNARALDDLGVSWLMSRTDHSEEEFIQMFEKAGRSGDYCFYHRIDPGKPAEGRR